MTTSCSAGLFVTVEGIDGAGKTTQISKLKAALENQGRQVCVTREPGGDELGETVRHLLLSGTAVDRAELLLFLAARAQNTDRVIVPALQAGAIVLCDRYIDSSTAYQGYGRGLDPGHIEALNTFATAALMPDITILLDISPTTGLVRQSVHSAMEREGEQFLTRVRQGFHTIAQNSAGRIVVLDAAIPVNDLHAQMLQLVNQRLSAKSASGATVKRGVNI